MRAKVAALLLLPALADLHPVPTPLAGNIVGEQSSSAGDQWRVLPPIAWGADFTAPTSLTITRASKHQTMIGWGRLHA